ncbi:MAG: UDP-N-acetylmuramoyl-L-alanyl-D-glutamate--2,6-diaminopimelate ligase [Calditrichaeota bacterium]|nr:MAG: UDP-N-acetylmuramoyl-L-alanyl-D-glutamate--2,6-diaminopimelate ligase [Calditrichota bacterium]
MRRISDIIADLPVETVIGDPSTMVREMHYDSRKVQAGDLFVAIRGFEHDGHDYIRQAYERGCRAFVVEKIPPLSDAVIVQVKDTRRWMPFLARNFYYRITDELKIVGITGTNGKTTTAYLLHSILEAAHWKPGLITTVETVVGEERLPSIRTTPESLDLHRLFYRIYRQGGRSAVMEVSSHALALHRTDGIAFKAAVFTNLGHDHLDFHKTMENYFRAKKKLFDNLHENDRAIINLDDPYGRRLLETTEADVFTYSLNNPRATVWLKSYQMLSEGMSLTVNVPSGTLFCSTSLVGKFNIYNLLAAIATGLSLGLLEEFIVEGIESLSRIPGRCERFTSPKGFRVYVDYAHTPEALQRVLEALLEFHPRRLTVVFGCGGDRDREKRPEMGRIAEDYADRIILTNDNPRSEDPLQIIAHIQEGMYDRNKALVIPDRREAIQTAIGQAEKNEIVLIAGKGHEAYQEFADRVEHFDDRELVRQLLEGE